MKTTKFKPLKLAFNDFEHKRYLDNLKDKQTAFTDLLGFCYRYLKEIEQEKLYKEPYQYFADRIVESAKPQFEGISFDKIAFIKDIDVSEFKEIVLRFSGINIELNPMTLEPICEPDFNIYSLNEDENRLYYSLQQMVKGMNLYRSIAPAQLQQMLRGVHFNHGTSKYEVDTRNILHTRRERGL